MNRFAAILLFAGILTAPVFAQDSVPPADPAAPVEPAPPAKPAAPAAPAVAAETAKTPDEQPSPTVDEILDRYVTAIGGRDAWTKLETCVSTGTIEIPSMNVTGTIEVDQKTPNKVVSSGFVAGANFGQGYDGTVGWAQDPMNGLREMSGEELAQAARDAQFDLPAKLPGAYPTMTLLGKEKVNDHDAYVIEATPAEGDAEKFYFDANSGLIIREVGTRDRPEGKTEFREDFSDFRDVDGVKLPFGIEQVMGELDIRITFSEIHHNVPVDDAKFGKPSAN